MSTLKVNNLQVGQDGTAANNYTLYQPASPDGTVRLGYGVPGSVTDILTLKNSKLGIGTNDPDTKLTVVESDNAIAARFKSTNGIFRILPFETGLGVKIAALNGTESSYEHLAIQGNSHSFVTNTIERLRITSAGVLQFAAGGNLEMASNGRIFVGNGGNATHPMFANVSDTNTGIAFPAADTMMFTTGGSERLRITSAGFVGINESAPQHYLHVSGGSGAFEKSNGLLFFAKDGEGVSTNTNNTHWIGRVDNAGYHATNGAGGFNSVAGSFAIGAKGPIMFATSSNTDSYTTGRVLIDTSGRFLIGTTTEGESNADDLTVATSGHTGMTIRSGTANRGNIYFSDGTSGDAEYRGYVTYDHDGDKFKFGTANADRLLIDSAGNFGINEATPDSKLDIIFSPTTPFSSTENLIHLRTDPSGSYASRGLFVKIGRDGPYDNSAAHYDIVGSAGNSGFHAFEVQGDEKLRITKDGNLFVAGTGGMNTSQLPNGNKININGNSSNDGFSIIRYNAGYGAYGLNIGRSKSGTVGTNAIVSDGNDIGHITFYGADGSSYLKAAQITANVDGTPSAGSAMPGRLVFKTSPDGSATPIERFRIKSNGDLKHTGLRIGGGDNKLAILVTPSHNTNEEDVIVYQVENESSFNQITFGGGTSGYNAATALIFKTASAVDTTGGTERLCIKSTGTVTVNNPTYSSNALVQIDAKDNTAYAPPTAYPVNQIELQNSVSMGSAIMRFRSQSSNGSAGIWNVGAVPRTNSLVSDFVFQSRTADSTYSEIARFSGSGGILFNGNTSQVNALDDYEEGTFTAILRSHSDKTSTSGYNTSTNSNYAAYTKVGNVVTVSVKWHALHNDARNHVLRGIDGLPFTSKSDNKTSACLGEQRGIHFQYSTSAEKTNSHVLFGYIIGNSTEIKLNGSKGSSPYSGWPATHNSTSSQYFNLTITYFTDS